LQLALQNIIIEIKKMLSIPKSNRIKGLLSLMAILIVIAVTIAAISDWHSDLCYHQDCVLCQFAQLSLIESLTGLDLPPPSIALLEIAPAPLFLVQSSRIDTTLTRGPPA
jgi:hypothetical protein